MSRRLFMPDQAVWTDYPFAGFRARGRGGTRAPFFEVTFLRYDGDKYATVRLPNGQEADVKIGYLHEKNPDDAPRFCLSGTVAAPHGSPSEDAVCVCTDVARANARLSSALHAGARDNKEATRYAAARAKYLAESERNLAHWRRQDERMRVMRASGGAGFDALDALRRVPDAP